MVRRHRVDPVAVDLRKFLAEELRQGHGDYWAALGAGVGPCRLADELDAGLAVEVAAWRLARWFDRPAPFNVNDLVRVEADGSVVVVRRPSA